MRASKSPAPARRPAYASSSEVRTQRSFLLNNDTGVKVGSIVLAATEQGMQYLVMPDGATLASVTTYHNRDDTGLMPATRVQLLVWKLDITTGTATQLGVTTEDPNSNLVAYQAHQPGIPSRPSARWWITKRMCIT